MCHEAWRYIIVPKLNTYVTVSYNSAIKKLQLNLKTPREVTRWSELKFSLKRNSVLFTHPRSEVKIIRVSPKNITLKDIYSHIYTFLSGYRWRSTEQSTQTSSHHSLSTRRKKKRKEITKACVYFVFFSRDGNFQRPEAWFDSVSHSVIRNRFFRLAQLLIVCFSTMAFCF